MEMEAERTKNLKPDSKSVQNSTSALRNLVKSVEHDHAYGLKYFVVTLLPETGTFPPLFWAFIHILSQLLSKMS